MEENKDEELQNLQDQTILNYSEDSSRIKLVPPNSGIQIEMADRTILNVGTNNHIENFLRNTQIINNKEDNFTNKFMASPKSSQGTIKKTENSFSNSNSNESFSKETEKKDVNQYTKEFDNLVNDLKTKPIKSFRDFENELFHNYKHICREYLQEKENENNDYFMKKENAILKIKLEDNMETSILQSEEDNNEDTKKMGFFKRIISTYRRKAKEDTRKDFMQKRMYYFERVINIILYKYKPHIFKDDDKINKKRFSVQTNIVLKKELKKLKQDDSYIKFSHELKEMDKQIIDKIANLKQEKTISIQRHESLIEEAAHKDYSLANVTELKLLNSENTLLKLIINHIYMHQYKFSHYIQWKTFLLSLCSRWMYRKEYFNQGHNKLKFKIKYLKTKRLIEKLILCKQTQKIGKYFKLEDLLQKNKGQESSPVDLLNFLIETNEKLPIMTFAFDTNLMVLFDFLVDIQILYFFFISPYVVVIQIDFTNPITSLSCFFHIIYFFDVLRKFRRLHYTETNVIDSNLFKLFKKLFLDFYNLISLFTLVPYVAFYNNITPFIDQETYNFLFLFPALRIIEFGKSTDYLEKTKYALICRLALLIIRFIILAHWIGLLFVKFVNFDYFAVEYYLESSCKTTKAGKNVVVGSCLYIIGLMDGTYLISGNSFSNLNLKSTVSEYFFVFFTFYVGQIIVAYVFGGVTSLIENLNQVAGLYREKLDNIKGFMLFYNFNDEIKQDINIYYDYLWLKKRNNIYDKEMLEDLSESLNVKIMENVYPHFQFFLKDFYGISVYKQKKFISSIVTYMKEYIAFPYERIYTQGNMVRGLFILTGGTAIFTDRATNQENNDDIDNLGMKIDTIRNDLNFKVSVNRTDYLENVKFLRINQVKPDKYENKQIDASNNTNNTIFPLDSIFMKTGRGIETCYVDDFSDFFVIDIKIFDEKLLVNFPLEMQKLKEIGKKKGIRKIGENKRLQNLVLKHSARSIDHNYEDEYNLENVWIEIKHRIPTIIDDGDNLIYKTTQDDFLGLFELKFDSSR